MVSLTFPLMKYRPDGEFDLSPDTVYSVARHRIDTVMKYRPDGEFDLSPDEIQAGW